jgi:hypothetical protein
VLTDDLQKLVLLSLALDAEPLMLTASRDLDALEKRMKTYAAVSQVVQRNAAADMIKKLQHEKNPMQRMSLYGQLTGTLMQQARYRTLIAVSRAVIADPIPPVNGYDPTAQAQQTIVNCYAQLHDDDGVLREGEKFLAKYPGSMMTNLVQMQMNNAINHKHAVADGKPAAAAEIGKLSAAERADPCKTAQIYKDHDQLAAAKRDYVACDARGGPRGWPPGTMALTLARLALDTNDAALMKKALARLERENPTLYRTVAFWSNAVGGE